MPCSCKCTTIYDVLDRATWMKREIQRARAHTLLAKTRTLWLQSEILASSKGSTTVHSELPRLDLASVMFMVCWSDWVAGIHNEFNFTWVNDLDCSGALGQNLQRDWALQRAHGRHVQKHGWLASWYGHIATKQGSIWPLRKVIRVGLYFGMPVRGRLTN